MYRFFQNSAYSGADNRFTRQMQSGLTFLKLLYKKIMRDDCTGLASQMAYNLIMSLIPALIFLISLFGIIGQQTTFLPLLLNSLEKLAPAPTFLLLKQTILSIVETSSTQLTILGLIFSLWSAARGLGVLVKGLSRAFVIRKQLTKFWYVPALSLLLMVSFGAMLIFSANMILFGDLAISWSGQYFQLSDVVLTLLNWGRWVLTVVGLVFFTSFVYALVLRPKRHGMAWRQSLPGATVFVALWITLSLLFRIYGDRMYHYNPVYGSMGVFVVLLFWFYLTSLFLLVGGEITAIIALYVDKKSLKSELS